MACVEGHSADRVILLAQKQALMGYAFCNGLMRFGLHAQNVAEGEPQVVLDWPDGGRSEPFDMHYAHAFCRGKTPDGAVSYKCGKLNALRFADSVVFTRMAHNTMMQIADLVVGGSKEFLECCLEKKPAGEGVECLRKIKHRFRGAPNSILNRGFSVPTGNEQLRQSIGVGIRNLLV